MDLNRLTQKSQESLHDAQTKALRFGHTEVDGEHLLLALLDQSEGLVGPLLAAQGRIRTGCARTWRPSYGVDPAFPVRVRRPVRCSSPSGSPT